MVPDAQRIFVIDAEANVRDALVALLREESFDVESAACGRAALAAIPKFRPRVVIATLQPHGPDAVELVAKLRRAPGAPTVIVVTAFGQNRQAVAALRAGASDYVTKPIHFEELLLVINKSIRQHELEEEVQLLRQQSARPPRIKHDR